MAIRGFFSKTYLTLSSQAGTDMPASSAVPYVRAIINVPSINKFVVSSFLIDTGADATIIHPQDGLRLFTRAQINALPNPDSFGGAGADKPHYPVEAEIAFLHDHGEIQIVPTTIYFSDPDHNKQFDSLLGRDVLDSFIMNFDQREGIVTLAG